MKTKHSPIRKQETDRTATIRSSLRRCFVFLVLGAHFVACPARAETILQYFGTSWSEITERMPEVAEAGYTALWLPPPFKAGSGIWSVGFDTYDRFDTGSKDQMGTLQTKYGTETELIQLVEIAHRFGIRVYFDNVMAHNGGPIAEGEPGTLNEIGFVPEDFHLIRTDTNSYTKTDWPDWTDEWQVLNRNPFGMDIAQEDPNDSFGWSEGDNYPKWSGIRHPSNPEYYPDTDLPLTYSNSTSSFTYYTFANKEPFQDAGYTNSLGTFVESARGNGRFDWEDLNSDGQHNGNENSESFTDTGIDPARTDHHVLSWGYGDSIYNMGNPYAEDVNAMLHRAARWFVDRVNPDGFRLDAVKHVPAYFFGKIDDPKNNSDWGYGGQIQVQFNISRGFSDWDNHRDTVFNNTQPRDDAMLYGEHLGSPPDTGDYLAAGMRIANDNFLNAVKSNIGSNLSGMDSPYYGIISPGESVPYAMSHDNNYLWDGDREQAHAILLTREGLPIVYTDGYNESGEPDWFPKPAKVPFLGQFGNEWMTNLLEINRNFGRGYQSSRWSSADYVSYTRYDENLGNNDHGVSMVFAMARNYMSTSPLMQGAATFPDGARLFNYSIYEKGKQVKVDSGAIVEMDGSPLYIAPNQYQAYSWRIPEMPQVWGNDLTNSIRPILIYENGLPVGTMTVTRTDGRDGDPTFNPYSLPDTNTTDYAYTIEIPRVTSSSNITFIARGDGSTENIQMKLDGGIDLNSQMDFITQDYGTRDNPPAISKDNTLGYEQMHYVQRGVEKFAAKDSARNVIGSPGAETYHCTIGSAGTTSVDGSGVNTTAGTAAWTLHDPEEPHYDGSSLQLTPAPQDANNQPITIWAKVGYTDQMNRATLYYTTDGTDPEGSLGMGKDLTQVVEMQFQTNAPSDGTGIAQWWSGTLPALPSGTDLRYKVAVYHSNASSRFPWSDDDLSVIPRMETQFEITDFNAGTVPNYPHNDWGDLTTGLQEGFHILRTKALLGRSVSDTPIYRENTQTFYYDATTPQGRMLYPETDGLTLGYSSYTAVVRTDMTVQEAWYKIEDTDSSNDDSQTGISNGNGAWVLARKAAIASPDRGASPEQRWEFDYVNIPNIIGTATLRVVLRESTSSTDLGLSDTTGHFTKLTRTVLTDTTGSGARMSISDPSSDGQTLGMGSNLTVRFSKWLANGDLTQEQLMSYFELAIDNEGTTPSTQTVTWGVSSDEHQIQYTLPNFYNGNPQFLHTLSVSFDRDSYPSLLSQRHVYSSINNDSNSDGIPDAWELQWGLNRMDLSPGLDYDDDGVNDYYEYIANTDPTDTLQFFETHDSYMQTNGYFNLIFNASYNRDYYVWYTESLSSPLIWTQHNTTPMPGTGQMSEYAVNTTGKSNCFYRLEVVLPEQ